MDFLDDEGTPDEKQAALIQAMRARLGMGQQQPQQGTAADFGRGWGNLMLQGGGGMNERLGQAQLTQAHQADSRADEAKKFGLMQLLEAQKEARRRKEHLSDTYSQRQWQDKRDELHRANELEAARIAAQKAGAPKPVTAAEAANIGALQTGAQAVDELGKAWDKETGTWSGITQYLPGTDAKQYSNKADVAAQLVGGILEGGKLGEADLPRYKAMMPQPGDNKETKAKKIETLKQNLELKRSGTVQGLGQAGYDVSGFPLRAPAADSAPAAKPRRIQMPDGLYEEQPDGTAKKVK